jgi:hypothetical protein
MIKELIKMANRLDSMGLKREADSVDNLIRKVAGGDPRSEREAAIMSKLKQLEPNFNEPRESLPLEERARLRNIEEQVKKWNNLYASDGSEGSEHSEGDQYGIKLDKLKGFVNLKDYWNSSWIGDPKAKRIRQYIIEDLKKEEKEKHDKEIEGSKPRYDYNMRTDSNTPSWFKGELGGKDLQMGGISLDDEGEWGYSDEGEEESYDMSGEMDSGAERAKMIDDINKRYPAQSRDSYYDKYDTDEFDKEASRRRMGMKKRS